VKAAAKNLTKKDLPADATFQQRYLRALENARAGKGQAEDRFLIELFARWNEPTQEWTDAHGIRWKLQDWESGTWVLSPGQDEKLDKHTTYKYPDALRLIAKGGELFVAAPVVRGGKIVQDGSPGLQADLNAAANIGLRALLDPDFPGRWWYVTCTEDKKAKSAVPLAKYTKGSACFPQDPTQFGSLTKEVENAVGTAKEKTTYFFSDPTPHPLRNSAAGGFWLPTPAYWRCVRKRVVAILRKLNGLPEDPVEDVNPDDSTAVRSAED
jgi:hypothetical protein